jgi:hypothetical protein
MHSSHIQLQLHVEHPQIIEALAGSTAGKEPKPAGRSLQLLAALVILK